MGCDIHLFLEIKKKEKWTFIKELDIGRSYDMFGIVADVRNLVNAIPISEPKGLPEDVSDKVREELDEWDCDGHSHSWLNWKEIKDYNWKQIFHDGRESCVDKKTGEPLWKSLYPNKDAISNDVEYKFLDVVAEDCISVDWIEVFNEMENLSHQYGSKNVRLVFWFDC